MCWITPDSDFNSGTTGYCSTLLSMLFFLPEEGKGSYGKGPGGKGILMSFPDEEAATKTWAWVQEWEAKDYFLLSVSKIMITPVCFLQVNEAEIPTNSYKENSCTPLKMLHYFQLCCFCVSGFFDLLSPSL